MLNFGDSNEKERPRSNAEKISDTLKTGKCSPIIPVVEDQEIISFNPEPNEAVENKGSNERSEDTRNAFSIQSLSDPLDTKKEDIPVDADKPKLESIEDLANDINLKNEKCSHDVTVVNDILVSNVSSSAEVLMTSKLVDLSLPGMTHQASQTDLEWDEGSSDHCSNPLMVDKGVGTSGLASVKTTSSTRPSASISGRTSCNPSVANLTRTPASQFTFAGVATKPASVNLRNSTSAAVKNTNTTSKPVPISSNPFSKAPSHSNGPTGFVSNASTTSTKIVSAAVASAKASVPTSSVSTSLIPSTPKASLFAFVTKSSSANTVKRNVAKPNPHM